MKGTAYFPIILKLEFEHLPKRAKAATVSKLLDQWATSPIKAGGVVAIKKHHKNNAHHEHRLGLFSGVKAFTVAFSFFFFSFPLTVFKGSSVALL